MARHPPLQHGPPQHLPIPPVRPTTNITSAICQNAVSAPTAASGIPPIAHAAIIRVRYRRGRRTDAVAKDPIAPPAPKNARMKPKVRASPPSWSATANGNSTSIGPMNRNTQTTANSSVHLSHGVRAV